VSGVELAVLALLVLVPVVVLCAVVAIVISVATGRSRHSWVVRSEDEE
jgi:hypothetical protein